jgi:hypothetical protein
MRKSPARNPRTGEVCPLGTRRVALFRFSPDVRLHVHEMPELQEALAAHTIEMDRKIPEISA